MISIDAVFSPMTAAIAPAFMRSIQRNSDLSNYSACLKEMQIDGGDGRYSN